MMRFSHVVLTVLILFVLCPVPYPAQSKPSQPHVDLSTRPRDHQVLYDEAKILTDLAESTERYLTMFRDDYGIDAVIITLLSREPHQTIEGLAQTVMSTWKIGKNFGSRGLLLLLIADTKEVKLEVSYELEDVFTDLFTGAIEDLQLKPYYQSGGLATGLIAVMEELEQRAFLKHQKTYTAALIGQLDQQFMSGGAGAKRVLSQYGKNSKLPQVPWTSSSLPGGKTPQEAWQIMLDKGLGRNPHPDRDIYTEAAKLITNDDQNNPDRRIKKLMRYWATANFKVLKNGAYAAIFFGKKAGWKHAPVLFAQTANGWKFDMVGQRKWITMGRAPKWGIQRTDHPYAKLLRRAPFWMRKDMPLSPVDRYHIQQDRHAVSQILALENAYGQNPDDFDTNLALGRLGVLTARRPQHVIPYLRKAQQLLPEHPLPYKYMAMQYVDATLQHKTALKQMKQYVALRPNDPFGHRFLGFLYLNLNRFSNAIDHLRQALEHQPDNCYAYSKLARAHAQRYLRAKGFNPLRGGYRKAAIKYYRHASAVCPEDSTRVAWLKSWLTRKSLLATTARASDS